MKYLVTGGAGFIGSNIVKKILEQGDEVRVLDNLSTGREENLAPFKDKIEFVKGSICDLATCQKAVDGIDYVLHQAALPSVPRSVEDPISSNDVNINGTLFLLESARQAGVKKFVMASSSSIYGDTEELPKHEKMTPSPLSPYAITKLTNEYYLKVYWELYQFPTVALRYFNIFGPNQDPKSDYAAVFPKFITGMLQGKRPIIFGDGLQSRDFTYVDNAVQANLLSATNPDIVGTQFNVACGAQYSLNDTVRVLNEVMGTDLEPVYDPPRPGDIVHSYASVDKLKKFGYDPNVQFKEGLEKTVAYYKKMLSMA